ncbi:MAG: hypothetical protein AB1403_19250, partial [Candidatus Riflebacteria bacterium]
MKKSPTQNKCNIFGRDIDAADLTSEMIADLLTEAEDQAQAAAKPDVECVLDVLQAVSECWNDPDYHLRQRASAILP